MSLVLKYFAEGAKCRLTLSLKSSTKQIYGSMLTRLFQNEVCYRKY